MAESSSAETPVVAIHCQQEASEEDELSIPTLLRQASELAKQGHLEVAKKDALKRCIANQVGLRQIDQAIRNKVKLLLLLQDKNWNKLMSELQVVDDGKDEACAEPAMTRSVSDVAGERNLKAEEIALLRELLKVDNERVIEWMKTGQEKMSALDDVVAKMHKERAECIAETMGEMEALLGIYCADLTVAQCMPLCVKITVNLSNINCGLQLGFLLPELYPLREPAQVRAYIPPPWDSSGSVVQELSDFLEVESQKNLGMGSLFLLVEAAKSWVEDHANLLVQRTLGAIPETANLITNTKGTASVDELELSRKLDLIVQQAQERTGMSGARARKQLRDVQWQVDKLEPSPEKKGSEEEQVLADMAKLAQTIRAGGPLSTFECPACMEDLHSNQGASMVCGHWVCKSCWIGYFQDQINDGKCFIPCLGHKCAEMVHEELIMGLVPAMVYKRYQRWLRFSFVKLQGWQWCPGTDCSRIAKAPVETKDSTSKIVCPCSQIWCFECLLPFHWPLTCDIVKEYTESSVLSDVKKKFDVVVMVEKFGMEDVSTKKCPRCKNPWWKNGGCNHFTCTCGHQFCWICLGAWANHRGSYYDCQEGGQEKEYVKNQTIKVSMGMKEVRIEAAELHHLRNYVERELYHANCLTRLAALLRDLPQTLTFLSGWKESQLYSSVFFLLDIHTLLRACYIFFYVHAAYFCLASIGTSTSNMTAAENSARLGALRTAKPLEQAFNKFEFAVTMLDLVVSPVNPKNRSAASFEQFQKSLQQAQVKAQSFCDIVVGFMAHVRAFRGGKPEPFANQFERLQQLLEQRARAEQEASGA